MILARNLSIHAVVMSAAFAVACSSDDGTGGDTQPSGAGGGGAGTALGGGTAGQEAGGSSSGASGSGNDGGASGNGNGGASGNGNAGASGSSSGGKGGTAGSNGSAGSAGSDVGGIDGGSITCGDLPAGADDAGVVAGALALTPGVWKNITPTDISGTFGANSVDLDPRHPLTVYASLDQRGIWKSTNGGATWIKLGNPGNMGADATSYIDSPLRVAVDPCDSNHLYVTQGVRGSTLGFWVSHDGGATWVHPPGFVAIAKTTTNDVTSLAIDPTNFAHVLVGSHSAWSGQMDAGIVESKDGGQTFVARRPASGGFQAGSVGIGFAYAPGLGIGNSNTWVLIGDAAGTWRTTDGGETWTKVSMLSGTHGGPELYVSGSGNLFFGGYQYPQRSTDNGATWSQVSAGLPYGYYLSVAGDGTHLYTLPSFPDAGAHYNQPYYTSLETDGTTWTSYQSGTQKFDDGPYRMRFDKVNRILYSANWIAGVWALKVLP